MSVTCPKCGAPANSPSSVVCTKCGHKLKPHKSMLNHCTNPKCVRYKEKYLFADDDMYCDICGEPTEYGKAVEDLI